MHVHVHADSCSAPVSVHTNTETPCQHKPASAVGSYRNLTGTILSPSAPRRHDQWGARDLAAASWAQSVWCSAEDRLRQTGGAGTRVDNQSPTGWDEIHQGGEERLSLQANHSFAITSSIQGRVGFCLDDICVFLVSVCRWEILLKRLESGCTDSLEECSNQCRSFRRNSG